MKHVIWACSILILSGCASQVISSSNRTVVVRAGTQRVSEAQSLADAECQKHGLHARLSMKAGSNQFVYDCVE